METVKEDHVSLPRWLCVHKLGKAMGLLIKLEDFDNFKDTLDYPSETIIPEVLDQVRSLD